MTSCNVRHSTVMPKETLTWAVMGNPDSGYFDVGSLRTIILSFHSLIPMLELIKYSQSRSTSFWIHNGD